MRTSVVLPAPFGPSRPNTIPPGTSSPAPSSATAAPKRLTTPSTRTAGTEEANPFINRPYWSPKGTKRQPLRVIPPGKVVGVGRYAVGNADGRYFAVTRRCRHLGADLAGGSIDEHGCLVCPWHHSAYDVTTGRMVRGPQGIFAKVPGLDFGYRMLTRVLPLGRARVAERDGELYIGG